MADITYYLNAYTTGVWTDPGNMIDGILTNYGTTTTDGATQALDGNTCPGTDLGTISNVETRLYGYGDADDQIIAKSWSGAKSTQATYTPGVSPVWTAYQSLALTTWAEVAALEYSTEFNKVGKGNTMHCAKVEIRVTYDEGGAPTPNAFNKIFYTSEPPTPNAWNQIKQDAGTGWRKLEYS